MDKKIPEIIANVVSGYPSDAQNYFQRMRKLVLETGRKTVGIAVITETLKWNEPSYLVKGGSTVRMGWTAKRSDAFGLYFNCNSKLVDTFRELYRQELTFDGNRAIILQMALPIPEDELAHCIALAFRYHSVKSLPLLGA